MIIHTIFFIQFHKLFIFNNQLQWSYNFCLFQLTKVFKLGTLFLRKLISYRHRVVFILRTIQRVLISLYPRFSLYFIKLIIKVQLFLYRLYQSIFWENLYRFRGLKPNFHGKFLKPWVQLIFYYQLLEPWI